jgi:phenylacetate-CoA ligase
MHNSLGNLLVKYQLIFRGMNPYPYLRVLEETQWWAEEKIEELQTRTLKLLLEHAYNNVPFYRKQFKRIGFVPEDFKSIQDLKYLPILTKEILKENYHELLAKNTEYPTLIFTSSGSTGNPIKIVRDKQAWAKAWAGKLRALRWYNVEYADRVATIWGRRLKRKAWVQRAIDIFSNRIRLGTFDLSDEALERFYSLCLRFQPVYINGYTSGIYRFAQFLLEKYGYARKLNIKLVLLTAETLYPYQREVIEKAFRCQVANEYGGCEALGVAYECPCGTFHITHENFYLEILREDGSPAPAGEIGKITITNLHDYAMPLIRYQNGDIGAIKRSICPCGRHGGLPSLVGLVGRDVDMIVTPSGRRVHPAVFTYSMRFAFEPMMVKKWQAIQCSPNEILVKLVKGPGFNEEAIAAYKFALQRAIGEEMKINIEFVSDIPIPSTGKFAYFIPMGRKI